MSETRLTSSYARGASEPRLLNKTIGQQLSETAARFGARDALISRHQGLRLTYQQLLEQSQQLASALLRAGIAKGDRVGIWSHNNVEWVLLQLATAHVGIILVNINPAYRTSELAYALNKVQCKALFVMERFKTSDYLGMVRALAPELETQASAALQIEALPDLRLVVWIDVAGQGQEQAGMQRFSRFIASGDAADPQVAQIGASLTPYDPINIQFTSGTTGFPKGATLTHRNIVNNGYFIGEAMRLSEEDRLCIPVPLYHCFGMVLGNMACMTHGAAMVYPNDGFDALTVLETVQAERCTGLHGVPTMFIAELDHPRFAEFDLSSLRTGIMAGSPCPSEVMNRVMERMHMQEVTIAYGMTETSPVSFQSATDDPVNLRVATIGRVHPHLEVKIVDGNGRIVPRGEKGELLTRGYSVMLGYWGDEVKTRDVIDPARWMHTGDLATIDDAGFATIVGRSKDMVIRGGENIYPREIEEFLYRHPKVQDVQCVGVPDAKYGEELCACIIVRPGMTVDEQDIRDFCQDQIARYKIPRYIRFVSAFPMTVTGKIQKYLLRQQITTDLGLGDQT